MSSEIRWIKTDRILYGIMCSGIALWAIAMFIEACRTRPKIQMMVLGVPKGNDNNEKAKAGPSSAAE